jgi:hypothetical protein
MSILTYADPVSLQQAQQKALQFMKSSNAPKAIRSARCIKSRTTATESTNLPLYIFNRGTNQGFVIISGNNSLPEVIGYTDSGDYDESLLPPALLDMIDGYAALSLQATENNMPPRFASSAHAEWQDITPLVQTHWHQSTPYNNLCPYLKGTTNRAATGCVATAACQILYYYHKDLPNTLQNTTPTYSYGDAPVTTSYPKGTPIKWDLMQLKYSGSYPYEYTNSVAVLNAAVGAATWLSYGSSTSGQISNVVNTYNSYFNLNSTCLYKSGYGESSWENILYSDIKVGRPILYSGVHTTNGGHAFVLDGYSHAADKFHFNFGWGGQGDGYYTVDDSTGCNGFSSQQGMVYNIRPKKVNLSATLTMPAKLFYRHSNEFVVTLKNNGTLPYSGVYLYASRAPMSVFQAGNSVASDASTVIEPGENGTLTLRHKPMLDGTYNYYVADINGNLLATDTATTLIAHPQLSYRDLKVSSSADNVTIGDKVYGLVHSSQANVTMQLHNADGYDPFEGFPRCYLYESTDQGKSFHEISHISTSSTVNPGENVPTSFNFTNLKTDTLYCAKISPTVETSKSIDSIYAETADTAVYFKIVDANLKLASTSDGCAKLSGSWNSSEFSKIAKANSTVTSYDLTEVKYVNNIPSVSNPNTLYYVAEDAITTGNNIIKSNVCDNLSLTYGYDFVPKAEFTAKNAVLFHNQAADQWNGIILPFDANVPVGILARRIDALKLTYIYKCENVTSMKAGVPYLFVSSQESNDRFEAQNVQVLAKTQFSNTDSVCGTFVNVAAGSTNYETDPTTNYFEKVSEGATLPAFSLYLNYTGRVRLISYPYISTDASYLKFATSIYNATSTYEKYAGCTETSEQDKLLQVIAESKKGFTDHAYSAPTDVAAAMALLDSIVNNYVASAQIQVKPGDDFTSCIINPSFEQGKKGWTLDANASIHTSAELTYKGVGIDGSYMLYNCLKADSTSTGVSQTVEGLTNGYYRMTALVATDPGNSVTIYAGDKKVSVSAHEFGVYYFNEGVIDSASVTNGTLIIGTEVSNRPYKLDHFTLTYLGAKPDPTSIVNLSTNVEGAQIYGGTECIYVNTEYPVRVYIYDISGRLVRNVAVSQGTTIINQIQRGLYIVNNKKVLVR